MFCFKYKEIFRMNTNDLFGGVSSDEEEQCVMPQQMPSEKDVLADLKMR